MDLFCSPVSVIYSSHWQQSMSKPVPVASYYNADSPTTQGQDLEAASSAAGQVPFRCLVGPTCQHCFFTRLSALFIFSRALSLAAAR
jgi:hypothetical protein